MLYPEGQVFLVLFFQRVPVQADHYTLRQLGIATLARR